MKTMNCPECCTSQTYYRRRTKDFACKLCPATFKKGTAIKSPKNTPLDHAMHPNKGLAK